MRKHIEHVCGTTLSRAAISSARPSRKEKMHRRLATALAALLGVIVLRADVANGQVVYSNNFESGLTGTTGGGVTAGALTPGGTLTGKTLVAANLGLLAPDSGTANNTNW